jgi:hypothetical protein
MLVLVALVASIAAADSLNPSTLGPALLFALGARARRDVAAFTAGVFAVSTAGGLVLALGPGRALLHVLSKPRPHTVHLIELGAGAAVLAVAAGLWLTRRRVAARLARARERTGRSALLLGAGIMAVELPTAFPYFAAVAAIVESRHRFATEFALVLLYNVVFVAPLAALLALIVLAGGRGARIAATARSMLDRYAPIIVPGVFAVLGLALLAFGAVGLKHG